MKPITLSKATDYEVRKYGATKWVSTKVIGMELDPAISKGFMRLFNYIQGNNEKSILHLIYLCVSVSVRINLKSV